MNSNLVCRLLRFTRACLRLAPGLAVVLILSLAAFLLAGAGRAQSEDPWPSFEQVKIVADQHFSAIKARQPNDLISQGDVQGLFEQIEKLGWDVADKKALVENVLPDSHFLVQQLRTPV